MDIKKIVFTLILISLFKIAAAQSCEQKLEDAKQAWHTGQLSQVESLLSGCLNGELAKDDRFDAYKLMVDAKLLLNEEADADIYMEKLLTLDPNYQPKEVDLAEFKLLFDSYEVVSKYSFGITGGILQPDYRIIKHQSISGRTEEPEDYDENLGFLIGLTGDLQLIYDFSLSLAVIYEQRGFTQQETILELQTVKSTEREYLLNIPLQLKYVFPVGKYRPFISGGFSYHYLLKAEGDLEHFALEPDFTGIPIGVPFSADDYDLTHLRRRHTFNWLVGAGIQTSFPGLLLELKMTYERGLNNLIEEEQRFSDKVLLDNFAYVPDDVKVSSWKFSLTLMRNYTKTQKK